MGQLPDYDDLPTTAGLPSSWGLWGPVGTDMFGCLNLQTPERIVAAAGLVQRGAVFPLNWSAGLPDPPLFNRVGHRHEVTGNDASVSHDDVLHGWNTQSSSQWDGFRHIRNMAAQAAGLGTGHYGGAPDESHGMHHWARRGIVGRAVLADVGRWRERIGRPLRCDQADPIEPQELLDCLADQGTEVREGDVLLLRTGWVAWYEGTDPETRAVLADRSRLSTPGLRSGVELSRTLWNLHIAAIAADNPAVEALPFGADRSADERVALRADPDHMHEVFSHTSLLPMLGLPLGEMWDLEALAADCAADGRYECFFTSAPLNLPSGVASPPNAIAIK